MMARKKRHFIMINLAYFNKFSEYIVWQRPLGMIHIYSRNELEPGRFVYIKKAALEQLWYEWRSKRRRNYRKWCSKSIRGTFPDIMNPDYKNNVLIHFDIDYYEGEKDKAISSIGVDTERKEINKYQKIVLDLIDKKVEETGKPLIDACNEFGMPKSTYYFLKKRLKPLENRGLDIVQGAII
jgi:hypothetical protein